MANLFATVASDVFIYFDNWAFFEQILVFIIFGLMLRVFAAGLIFVGLTTAPPNLPTKLTPMYTTTPLEVIFFYVILASVLASFLSQVKLSFLRFEFLYSILHLFSFDYKVLFLFIERISLFEVFFGFLSFRLKVLV